MSWKVRRSAYKALSSLITLNVIDFSELFARVAPVLLARFKEREETVRVDIVLCFAALLRQYHNLFPSVQPDNFHQQNILEGIRQTVPSLVSHLSKQLKHKFIKARQASLTVLATFASSIPGALAEQMQTILVALSAAFMDKQSNSSQD
eukprot:m.907552 g.907552  ORF g.907552 m.907552 type:complete len:149 (+) comp60092_c0_seq6:1033-1479(+)